MENIRQQTSTWEADECFGSEFIQAQGLHKFRHRLPIGLPGHLCRRVTLEELPQCWYGHLAWSIAPPSQIKTNAGLDYGFVTIVWQSNVCMHMLDLTAGLIQKNGGHQELPGVVEKSFLYEVVRRARRCPLLECLPPRWAEGCAQMIDIISLSLTPFISICRDKPHVSLRYMHFISNITFSWGFPAKIRAGFPFVLRTLGL